MDTTDEFLDRCRAYCEARGIARSYLSRLLFDDGKVIEALAENRSGITLKRLCRATTLLGEFERAMKHGRGAAQTSSCAAAA